MATFLSKPVALVILDGVGVARPGPGNAVTKASTPFLERAWDSYPHTLLNASGEYVGLPPGIKGNSEVGHMNLGSGRIVFQELPRINRAIQKGAFMKNTALLNAFDHAVKRNSRLHAAVCLSDAGVHGTITHLEALLNLATSIEFTQPLIIHAFTDGRDSPPKSAATYFTILEETIDSLKIGTIGSVTGRYYAMDRNQVWDRVHRTYSALVEGAALSAGSWREALESAYSRNETDEFIKPTLVKSAPVPDPTIHNEDAFILLNYRADRAIELASALTLPEFNQFPRKTTLPDLHFVGMTQYAKGIPRHIAFPTEDISLPLGRILAEHNQRQLRLAESEKFPHVTYFFNGGRSIKFTGEDRIEIPSPNVATYDMKPEMSLPELTRTFLNKTALKVYDFFLINLANGDMIGHTGVFDAGVQAMTAVDHSVEQMVSAIRAVGGTTIITADHGNAEEMVNLATGEIDTEHSLNPVPFIIIPPEQTGLPLNLQHGSLCDVAPTVLSIMGIPIPAGLGSKSLIG